MYLNALLLELHSYIEAHSLVSDMMIAPGRGEMSSGGGYSCYGASSGSQCAREGGVSGILRQFREKVNPDLLFVSVDLHGSGSSQVQLEDGAEGAHPNDVLVTGYSDEILRYVVEVHRSSTWKGSMWRTGLILLQL